MSARGMVSERARSILGIQVRGAAFSGPLNSDVIGRRLSSRGEAFPARRPAKDAATIDPRI